MGHRAVIAPTNDLGIWGPDPRPPSGHACNSDCLIGRVRLICSGSGSCCSAGGTAHRHPTHKADFMFFNAGQRFSRRGRRNS